MIFSKYYIFHARNCCINKLCAAGFYPVTAIRIYGMFSFRRIAFRHRKVVKILLLSEMAIGLNDRAIQSVALFGHANRIQATTKIRVKQSNARCGRWFRWQR